MHPRTKRLGAVAAIATAVAIPAEGLLRRSFPSLSVPNEVDKRLGNTSDDCQRMWSNPLVKQLSDVYDLLGRKFVHWLVFPMKINKASFPSMLAVSGNANPLKVFSSVISLDSVNVVDAKPWFVPIDKCRRNKAMHHKSNFPSVRTKTNFFIPGVVRLWRVFLRLSSPRYFLLFAKPNSCVRVSSSRNTNSPFAADFKRNSALRYGFPLFHDVFSFFAGVAIIGVPNK